MALGADEAFGARWRILIATLEADVAILARPEVLGREVTKKALRLEVVLSRCKGGSFDAYHGRKLAEVASRAGYALSIGFGTAPRGPFTVGTRNWILGALGTVEVARAIVRIGSSSLDVWLETRFGLTLV